MDEDGWVLRPVARVLLIDARERILLLHANLAYTDVWLAPGGALENGEDFEAGAVRELAEETGLRDVSLGPCIGELGFRFAFEGRRYAQTERYFLARVESHQLDRSGWQESEKGEIADHRWWSVPDLRQSTDSRRPAELADLLPDLIAGRLPALPLKLSVEPNAHTI